ncbi:hypothetical protein [Pseudonocardia sp. ICBG601]|uniref:hypothetical protein n=1 Tax=Pseudonocardia sp. ICBG601 TaxID=2846759 RepID=UPI0027E266AB|nr:hypothetical protein [Pseudonocardia sp. ICBG601]
MLLCPTTRLRATPIGRDRARRGAGAAVDAAADLAAQPAGPPVVALPVPVPGLPAGVQLVGITVGEDVLLGLARALEGALR